MATQTLVLQVLSKGWGQLNADLARTEINWKKTLNSMAKVTGKMTGVMTMLNTGGVELDGHFGKGLQKGLALASILSSGGPLGVAMAGVAAGAMAGKYAYDLFSASSTALEAEQRSLAKALEAQAKFHKDQIKTIDDLDKKLRDFGKTQYQVQVEDLKRSIEMRKGSTAVLQEDVKRATDNIIKLNLQLVKEKENYSALTATPDDIYRIKDLEAQIKLEAQVAKNAADNLDRSAAATAADMATLTRVEMLNQKTEESTKAEERKERAKKATTEAIKVQIDLDQQMQAIDARMAIMQANFEETKRQRTKAVYDAEIAEAQRMNDARLAAEDAYIAKVKAAQEERSKYHALAMDQIANISAVTSEALGAALAGMVAGTATGADAIKNVAATALDAVVNSAINMVTAYAASSSAAAFFSQAGIPVVGPLLATAAAATAGAFVRALIGQIRQAAYGFDMTGGGHAVGGRDTQLVAMDPKREKILDANQSAQPARGSGGLELHLHMSPDQGNAAEAERYALRTMLPTLRRLYDQGHLGFLAGARA